MNDSGNTVNHHDLAMFPFSPEFVNAESQTVVDIKFQQLCDIMLENSQFEEMLLLVVQAYVRHHKSHQLQCRSVSPYQNLGLAELRPPPLVSKDIDPVISSLQKLFPFLSTKGMRT